MANKTKAEILSANPEDLSPSDLKKYQNWTETKTSETISFQSTEDEVMSTITESDPLELTPEVEAEILANQEEEEKKRKENKAKTVIYDNDYNVPKLIYRNFNDVLGIERLIAAVPMGKIGVMVIVTEKQDTKVAVSTTYIPDATLRKENDKYVIK